MSDSAIESICGTLIILMVLWLCFGCATKGLPSLNEQLDFNQQIQDCIVQGGHPHLGPGRTVICE